MSATISKDVSTLAKQLSAQSNAGSAQGMLSIMDQLDKLLSPATEDVLRITGIGKVVARLRNSKFPDVSKRSGELVKKWRDQVILNKRRDAETKSADTTPKTSLTPLPSPSAPAPAPTPLARSVSTSSSQGSSAPPTRSMEGDKVKFSGLGDKIRDKCVELLYKALAVDASADGSIILERSLRIEQAVWVSHQRISGEKYRGRVRTLSLKLKGSANPSLRHSLVDGDLAVESFCSMTDAEMKSEEQKRKEKEIYDENLFKAQGAAPKTAETDMFQCGKCKQRKCTYYQMQTRSADEPMTTFVTCVVCDNRWKFC